MAYTRISSSTVLQRINSTYRSNGVLTDPKDTIKPDVVVRERERKQGCCGGDGELTIQRMSNVPSKR